MWRCPAGWARPLAIVLAAPLLVEMHLVVRNDKQVPLDQVTLVPRDEQYAVFNGNPPIWARAARAFDQKYPLADLPDVWVHDTGVPSFPEWTFFGPRLTRRLHYWTDPGTPLGAGDLPGAILTRDGTRAQRLAQEGTAAVDQLTLDIWLVLPNDRLRVRWNVFQPAALGNPVLRLEATVPAGRYGDPSFGFFINTNDGERTLQRFSPSPTLDVPLDQAGAGTIRVEVRDGANGRTAERVRIERPKFMGL